jgi:hypothetical protein
MHDGAAAASMAARAGAAFEGMAMDWHAARARAITQMA